MPLKDIVPKDWLPKGWEEISREGTEMQILIKFGHLNPEDKADPLLVSGNPTAEINGETYTVHGIQARGTMSKFFEVMKKNAESGFMKGYTPGKIEGIREQFNKGIINEKYDTASDITITKYPDAKAAKEALENQITLHTKGFNFEQIFENPAFKQVLTKDQLAKIGEMKEKMKDSKVNEQIAEAAEKNKYSITTYLGCPAVVSEIDNPDYERYMAPKPIVKRDPNKFVGGGFDPLAGKGVLPQKPKAGPPPKVIQFCVAIQVDNFVIMGSLLYSVLMLPSSGTFTESLTKSKTYVETEKVEGQTYTTKYLVPVESNYANEGYVNKEEVEGMLKKVIGYLKK